jgi:hypothetical protein
LGAAATLMMIILLPSLIQFAQVINYVSQGKSSAGTFPAELVLAIVYLVAGLFLSAVLFLATWLVLEVAARVRPSRCPTCGQIPMAKRPILAQCNHCDGQLASWLFVQFSNSQ